MDTNSMASVPSHCHGTVDFGLLEFLKTITFSKNQRCPVCYQEFKENGDIRDHFTLFHWNNNMMIVVEKFYVLFCKGACIQKNKKEDPTFGHYHCPYCPNKSFLRTRIGLAQHCWSEHKVSPCKIKLEGVKFCTKISSNLLSNSNLDPNCDHSKEDSSHGGDQISNTNGTSSKRKLDSSFQGNSALKRLKLNKPHTIFRSSAKVNNHHEIVSVDDSDEEKAPIKSPSLKSLIDDPKTENLNDSEKQLLLQYCQRQKKILPEKIKDFNINSSVSISYVTPSHSNTNGNRELQKKGETADDENKNIYVNGRKASLGFISSKYLKVMNKKIVENFFDKSGIQDNKITMKQMVRLDPFAIEDYQTKWSAGLLNSDAPDITYLSDSDDEVKVIDNYSETEKVRLFTNKDLGKGVTAEQLMRKNHNISIKSLSMSNKTVESNRNMQMVNKTPERGRVQNFQNNRNRNREYVSPISRNPTQNSDGGIMRELLQCTDVSYGVRVPNLMVHNNISSLYALCTTPCNTVPHKIFEFHARSKILAVCCTEPVPKSSMMCLRFDYKANNNRALELNRYMKTQSWHLLLMAEQRESGLVGRVQFSWYKDTTKSILNLILAAKVPLVKLKKDHLDFNFSNRNGISLKSVANTRLSLLSFDDYDCRKLADSPTVKLNRKPGLVTHTSSPNPRIIQKIPIARAPAPTAHRPPMVRLHGTGLQTNRHMRPAFNSQGPRFQSRAGRPPQTRFRGQNFSNIRTRVVPTLPPIQPRLQSVFPRIQPAPPIPQTAPIRINTGQANFPQLYMNYPTTSINPNLPVLLVNQDTTPVRQQMQPQRFLAFAKPPNKMPAPLTSQPDTGSFSRFHIKGGVVTNIVGGAATDKKVKGTSKKKSESMSEEERMKVLSEAVDEEDGEMNPMMLLQFDMKENALVDSSGKINLMETHIEIIELNDFTGFEENDKKSVASDSNAVRVKEENVEPKANSEKVDEDSGSKADIVDKDKESDNIKESEESEKSEQQALQIKEEKDIGEDQTNLVDVHQWEKEENNQVELPAESDCKGQEKGDTMDVEMEEKSDIKDEKVDEEVGKKVDQEDGEKVDQEDGEKVDQEDGEKVDQEDGEKVDQEDGEKVDQEDKEKMDQEKVDQEDAVKVDQEKEEEEKVDQKYGEDKEKMDQEKEEKEDGVKMDEEGEKIDEEEEKDGEKIVKEDGKDEDVEQVDKDARKVDEINEKVDREDVEEVDGKDKEKVDDKDGENVEEKDKNDVDGKPEVKEEQSEKDTDKGSRDTTEIMDVDEDKENKDVDAKSKSDLPARQLKYVRRRIVMTPTVMTKRSQLEAAVQVKLKRLECTQKDRNYLKNTHGLGPETLGKIFLTLRRFDIEKNNKKIKEIKAGGYKFLSSYMRRQDDFAKMYLMGVPQEEQTFSKEETLDWDNTLKFMEDTPIYRELLLEQLQHDKENIKNNYLKSVVAYMERNPTHEGAKDIFNNHITKMQVSERQNINVIRQYNYNPSFLRDIEGKLHMDAFLEPTFNPFYNAEPLKAVDYAQLLSIACDPDKFFPHAVFGECQEPIQFYLLKLPRRYQDEKIVVTEQDTRVFLNLQNNYANLPNATHSDRLVLTLIILLRKLGTIKKNNNDITNLETKYANQVYRYENNERQVISLREEISSVQSQVVRTRTALARTIVKVIKFKHKLKKEIKMSGLHVDIIRIFKGVSDYFNNKSNYKPSAALFFLDIKSIDEASPDNNSEDDLIKLIGQTFLIQSKKYSELMKRFNEKSTSLKNITGESQMVKTKLIPDLSQRILKLGVEKMKEHPDIMSPLQFCDAFIGLSKLKDSAISIATAKKYHKLLLKATNIDNLVLGGINIDSSVDEFANESEGEVPKQQDVENIPELYVPENFEGILIPFHVLKNAGISKQPEGLFRLRIKRSLEENAKSEVYEGIKIFPVTCRQHLGLKLQQDISSWQETVGLMQLQFDKNLQIVLSEGFPGEKITFGTMYATVPVKKSVLKAANEAAETTSNDEKNPVGKPKPVSESIEVDDIVQNETSEASKDGSEALSKDGSEALSKDGSEALSKDGSEALSKDGSEALSKDGSEALSKDGSEALSNKDGSEALSNKDGSEVLSNKDGSEELSNKDGSEELSNKDGSEALSNKDGSEALSNKDGSEALSKDGSEALSNKDGSEALSNKDGSEALKDETKISECKDGETKISECKDGETKISECKDDDTKISECKDDDTPSKGDSIETSENLQKEKVSSDKEDVNNSAETSPPASNESETNKESQSKRSPLKKSDGAGNETDKTPDEAEEFVRYLLENSRSDSEKEKGGKDSPSGTQTSETTLSVENKKTEVMAGDDKSSNLVISKPVSLNKDNDVVDLISDDEKEASDETMSADEEIPEEVEYVMTSSMLIPLSDYQHRTVIQTFSKLLESDQEFHKLDSLKLNSSDLKVYLPNSEEYDVLFTKPLNTITLDEEEKEVVQLDDDKSETGSQNNIPADTSEKIENSTSRKRKFSESSVQSCEEIESRKSSKMDIVENGTSSQDVEMGDDPQEVLEKESNGQVEESEGTENNEESTDSKKDSSNEITLVESEEECEMQQTPSESRVLTI